MRKRVLIAESADTVRSVAENILRQNGYEVISVAAGDRASEVLQFSRPDLMLVGADLAGSDSTPFYQKIFSDPKLGPVPTLVIAPADGSQPDVAEEMIIQQPFDPQQLLEKVSAVLENKLQPVAGKSETVSASLSVDDDFLDTALGLDEINVTDSEVMDKTKGPKSKLKKHRDADSADTDDHEEDEPSKHSRVESLLISEDSTDIVRKDQPSKPPSKMAGTGKLEIVSDQFGLEDLNAADSAADHHGAHDYDWFVDSMRQDNVRPPANAGHQSDSGGLAVEPNSSSIDPITPGPKEAPTKDKKSDNSDNKEGVEQFIDEFKKEMEVLRSHEPESIVIKDGDSSADRDEGDLTWEEQLEKLTPREVGLFTQRFCRELAEKLAEVIAAKIDPEKLLELLKAEITNQARKK